MVTAAGGEVLFGKYELGRLLGRGAFAKVYKARSVAGDVAIKVINKTKIANTTMAPRILREVSLMRRINHPNVVKLHEVMATKSKIYMVMEYAPGGELLAKVSGRTGRSPLTEPIARKYIQQLVSALHFCHSNGVSHRDVKPQNLLLDGDGNLKVSDFGLSALPEQIRDDGLLHTACGTPAYTAPEVVRRKGYDGAKSDAWSCGVILFYLLAGHLPFDDANLNIMYRKIHRREYDFPARFSPAVRRIVARLLDPNPDTRMTIEALMKLSWFKKSYQPVTNASFDCPFKDGKSETSPVLPMNAFDIISLSSGLDLSGLFEGGKKKEKRFTSTASPEKIAERAETIGEKLGYRVERRKCGSVGLAKTGLVVSVEVQEMAPSLFLVGMKASGGDQETEMEDLKSGLEDIVLDWINDGI